ncbi:hypothetical protein PSTT_08362 [Puccinia striiformis]|uniref:Uncharacterized protein n=1 Tax=Puccinia striiformis TaxID=27350 RepID=A0A2S4VCP4_9BASI|nr:hypothetical protein PSTT_08362 [Puccinia striiformis]
MKSKLNKIGAWQVVNGEKQLKEEDKRDEKVEYYRLDQVASNKLVEHLDSNHLGYVSQSLLQTESSSGYSIWRLLKHKYAGNDHISKDLALDKFLELQYIDSMANFIAEAQQLIIGLLRQSVGCANNTVAIMLNRLEKHTAQNYLDQVSMTKPQQVFLATGEKIYIAPQILDNMAAEMNPADNFTLRRYSRHHGNPSGLEDTPLWTHITWPTPVTCQLHNLLTPLFRRMTSSP